jgi:hypothetical protein
MTVLLLARFVWLAAFVGVVALLAWTMWTSRE